MKKKAFTLAEVLITLTIIGVIAALTIPNLMQKWQDGQIISGLKTAHSIFDNAIKMAIREEGAIMTDWNWPAATLKGDASLIQSRGNYLAERIKPYLKVKEYCGNDKRHLQDVKCHSYAIATGDYYYKYLNGRTSPESTRNTALYGGQMMLENGMTAAIYIHYPKGATSSWTAGMYRAAKDFIGNIVVDINGKKGPNTFGIDVFMLPINGKGVAIDRDLAFLPNTNVESRLLKSECVNKSSKGTSCSIWILLHHNVDYKYRDVSAEW